VKRQNLQFNIPPWQFFVLLRFTAAISAFHFFRAACVYQIFPFPVLKFLRTKLKHPQISLFALDLLSKLTWIHFYFNQANITKLQRQKFT